MKDIITDNQQTLPEELGWIAGALDSEGHLRMQKGWVKKQHRFMYRVEVNITNTCSLFLEKCKRILQKLGVNPYIRQKDVGPSGKACFNLVITKMKHVKRFLEPILHLLTTKKAQAEFMLRFVNRRIGLCELYGRPDYDENDMWFFDEWERLFRGQGLRDYQGTPEEVKV